MDETKLAFMTFISMMARGASSALDMKETFIDLVGILQKCPRSFNFHPTGNKLYIKFIPPRFGCSKSS